MTYFYLYASCIPVQGYSRSIIIDTLRNTFIFIPNSLYYILTEWRNETMQDIKNNVDNVEIVEEYFNFLIGNELGIYVGSLDNFPLLNLTYDSPRKITNAIIEISKNSAHNYSDIVYQLTQLNTESLELLFYNDINDTDLFMILDLLTGSTLRSVSIFIPYSEDMEELLLKKIIEYPRIVHVLFYGSKEKRASRIENTRIEYVEQETILANNCGNISPQYFSCNIDSFIEAQSHNICLNKKVCISAEGNIKNCSGCSTHFGNIKEKLLSEIIDDETFRRLWNIKKDDIKVCKDCEFRYICFDCRVFIENQNDIYSHPSKCKYNPYIAKWEGEKGYMSINEFRELNQ